MALFYLRGEYLGRIDAVLFDKDGTLSYSQPNLEILAQARIFHSQQLIHPKERENLRNLLETSYGLNKGILNPGGAIAVASRQNNLISTATAFCQTGLIWPNALKYSSVVFHISDNYFKSTNEVIDKTTELLLPFIESLNDYKVICGVISNDSEVGIWQFLRHHKLRHLVKMIWSASDRPSKPNPQTIYHFCEVARINPAHCLLISDADTDLYMGEKAHVSLSLGYTKGWKSKTSLFFGNYSIDNWSEITLTNH
uniref:Uncharacterized protein n=1 Tax=Paulinella chromatophora TaxID=39717 RepID=B1X538_PAUCH|nr:hypothetical protein PCC_0632 [Paulinella chromatophora]ACB43057.1 hypothetical protein PCC_0632 [Paulinella chromatophora]